MHPFVSVSIITYNHKHFIRDCLDGVLKQQTTFPFEIILGEDESSDGTREICIEYAEKYPDKIRLFLRSRKDVIYINGSPTGRFNNVENLKAARGKYIALCEGDDYWTDPLKLQKQVEFLEANSSVKICYHPVLTLIESDKTTKNINSSKAEIKYASYSDVVKSNNIPTCSAVFRKENSINFPDWYLKLPFGDWSLWLLLLKEGGYAVMMPDTMAIYRYHSGGIWSQDQAFNLQKEIAKKNMFFNLLKDQLLKKKYRYPTYIQFLLMCNNIIKHKEGESLNTAFIISRSFGSLVGFEAIWLTLKILIKSILYYK